MVIVNGSEHENGTAATWINGMNEVIIFLLDGEDMLPGVMYRVIVTKSGDLGALTVASQAGSAQGMTAISVTEQLAAPLTRMYKTGVTVDLPALDDDLTDWTAWNGTDEIAAATGDELAIAYVLTLNNTKYAKHAGKATVTAAE